MKPKWTSTPRPYLSITGTTGEGQEAELLLYAQYGDREICKEIQRAKWNPKRKAWVYPAQPDILQEIKNSFPALTIKADALGAIQAIADHAEKIKAKKAAGWEDVTPDSPMPIKNATPFQHQIMGYNLAIAQPSHAMLYEQGCGKTLTAIATIGRRFLDGEITRVLIVAPASVVPVWENEFAKFADFPHEVATLAGMPVKKRKAALEDMPEPLGVVTDGDMEIVTPLQVAVINYEATWRMEEELRDWGPDLILCDESQRIKTPGTRQSKGLHNLGRRPKFKLILSGTPVTQGPLDFFSQYKFLDPQILGNSYYACRNRYAVMGGYQGYQIVGYRRMDEFMNKVHSISFRVTKAEALDLPDMIEQELYCELEPKARTAYRELLKESVTELEGETQITAVNVLAKLLRLSQMTGGFIGTEEGEIVQASNAKMKLLTETMEDILGQGKKLVIFARFIPEIHAIRKKLEEMKVDYSWIAGEIKMEDRGEMVQRFQEDPECRVFLAQIQTAGLGITLHAADTAIFYSLDYSFANLDQAMARLHRIGQKNKVTNIFLIARDTVDEKVRAALAQKQDVAKAVVDGENWREVFKV